MKNATPFLFSFALVLACCPLFAQEIKISWDRSYPSPATEKLNDLIMLDDSLLIGVGEIHRNGKPKAGLFVVIDLKADSMLNHQIFPGFGNRVLKSLTAADDGTFYLVGNAEMPDKDRQGWLLRLDENYEEMQNQLIGEKDKSEQLEKIAWLNNGQGLMVGFSERKPEGELWMLGVDGGQPPLDKNIPLGRGMVGSIVGMQKTANNRLWLAGNLHPGEGKGGAWLIQINQDGMPQVEEKFGGQYFESIQGMFVASDKAVLLAGEISQDQFSDTWVVEYEPGIPVQSPPKTVSLEGNDHASAILKTPGQQRWLTVRQGKEGVSIITWDQSGMEEKPQNIANSNFKALRLLRTRQGSFIMAGMMKDDKTGREHIRLICFEAKGEPAPASAEKRGSGSKGDADAKIEFANFRLDDENGDGFVSPGERASVHFDVLNTGDTDVSEGEIQVIAEPLMSGLNVPKRRPHEFLSAHEGSDHCSISLRGEPNLKEGTSKLTFVIRADGKEFKDSYPVRSIETKKAVGGSSTHVSIQSHTPSGDERKITSTEKTVDATFRSRSTRRLEPGDPKLDVIVGGTVREDQKANIFPRYLFMEDGLFVHEFVVTLQLDTGINLVQIKLDDYLMEPLQFELAKTRPNLHILAIGPDYGNLNYPAKDAREFAEALARQEGLGFFDKIFIDTLLSPENTQRQNIEDAFNALLNRYNHPSDSTIKDTDYLVVFYSGHGEKIDGSFKLIPTNYKPGFISTCLDYKELLDKYLGKILCRRVLFIDACLSGSADVKNLADKTMAQALLEANSSKPGIVCFTSCSTNESSFEDAAWQNGAFTEALLEALEGKYFNLTPLPGESAAPVSVRHLQEHLEKRVPELVKSAKKAGTQTPDLKLNGVKDSLTIFAVH